MKMAEKRWWWGRSVSVDLHEYDVELLTNPNAIKKFVRGLVKVLKMKRHGPTRIEKFGSGKLKGWSAMQFIKTSSITIHCDDKGKRAFIDIFSCKKYNPRKVGDFCKKFFKASTVKLYVKERL